MTNIEKQMINDDGLNAYLEDVSPAEFREDIKNLIKEYSDNGAIKRAIELLNSAI